jgi:hypothetical protein
MPSHLQIFHNKYSVIEYVLSYKYRSLFCGLKLSFQINVTRSTLQVIYGGRIGCNILHFLFVNTELHD